MIFHIFHLLFDVILNLFPQFSAKYNKFWFFEKKSKHFINILNDFSLLLFLFNKSIDNCFAIHSIALEIVSFNEIKGLHLKRSTFLWFDQNFYTGDNKRWNISFKNRNTFSGITRDSVKNEMSVNIQKPFLILLLTQNLLQFCSYDSLDYHFSSFVKYSDVLRHKMVLYPHWPHNRPRNPTYIPL